MDGGINVGGQVGYNLQRNNLVYGIEVDFGKFGFDGEGPSETSPDTTASSKGGFSTGLPWTPGLRLGQVPALRNGRTFEFRRQGDCFRRL